MSATLEQIEIKIAYLEQANAELSDVVYRQRLELESLRARLSELIGRFDTAQASVTTYSAEDERPPHY
jgi:SlyX protein